MRSFGGGGSFAHKKEPRLAARDIDRSKKSGSGVPLDKSTIFATSGSTARSISLSEI